MRHTLIVAVFIYNLVTGRRELAFVDIKIGQWVNTWYEQCESNATSQQYAQEYRHNLMLSIILKKSVEKFKNN